VMTGKVRKAQRAKCPGKLVSPHSQKKQKTHASVSWGGVNWRRVPNRRVERCNHREDVQKSGKGERNSKRGSYSRILGAGPVTLIQRVVNRVGINLQTAVTGEFKKLEEWADVKGTLSLGFSPRN